MPSIDTTATLLINGSPRGKESNSRLILSWVAAGLAGQESPVYNPGDSAAARSCFGLPVIELARTKEIDAQLSACDAAGLIVLAFPLYTDSVPAIVKAFLEQWAERRSPAQRQGKRLAVIIQSGFPESIHSENTAAWFGRLTARLGLENAGIIIKGGIEGIRIQPESLFRKAKLGFVQAGRDLATQGSFGSTTVKALAGFRRLNWAGRLLLRVLVLSGLGNFYWNMRLKEHGAFDKRFDAPWGPAFGAKVRDAGTAPGQTTPA